VFALLPDEAFAMRTELGVVLAASAEGPWQPELGEVLCWAGDDPYPRLATVAGGTARPICIKLRSDLGLRQQSGFCTCLRPRVVRYA